MSYLALFLFGPPRIERDGKPVKIGRRKAIALSAYLAVTGVSHSRSTLAAFLWPERGRDAARTALCTTLYALKKTLGENWFDVDRKAVGLHRNTNFWVDVDHFYSLLAQCGTHGHPPEEVCSTCLSPLAEVVELYRDDFMAGFTLRDSLGFDDWQRSQTSSLRRELVRALEKLSRGHSAQGAFEQAIAYTQRWLALEPYQESAHRQMMRLYTWSGRQAAALRQYWGCVQLLETELHTSPQQATDQLYRDIQDNRLPLPPILSRTWSPTLHLHNFPTPLTPFLGRERELSDIAKLLRDPVCRLLTLVGPGGIGKTRLALQAATENARAFAHGACFIPLTSLGSVDLLAAILVDALKLAFQDEVDPEVELLYHLRGREMLLVLDNFEHLLPSSISSAHGGAGLLAEILSAAPGVKLLVTSRECLNLQWEWLIEVHGLDFPRDDEAAAIQDCGAVQLFLQSARRVQPSLSLSEKDRRFVNRICRYLEGIPLGIELAAAWVHSLSCQEIAQKIERDPSFLGTAQPGGLERHHSLQVVFDQSWHFLSDAERCVTRKQSVFRGGFRREAAERVAGASLFLLLALVRKSFLRRSATGRYEMLEVLRQYAEEKLQGTRSEKKEVHNLHCEYYAEFLHRREERLEGKGQKRALEEIGEEIENVRAAWGWAAAHGKAEEIAKSLQSLYRFYFVRGWHQEGEQVFGKAIKGLRAQGDATGELGEERAVILGRALARQGRLCHRRSHFDRARELLQESLSILRCLGAQREVAFTLKALGNVAYRLGEYAEAKRLFQEGLAIYKESGDRRGADSCFNNLGLVELKLKEYAEAKRLFQENLASCKEIGDQWGMATALSNLGIAIEGLGEYRKAQRAHQECLEIFKEIGARRSVANSYNNLGFATCALGEYQKAREYFQEALETALDVQSVLLALEALVGIATLLTKEGQEEQVLELTTHTLYHPVVYMEIRRGIEPILSELERELLMRAFYDPTIYEKLRDRVREIKGGAERPSPDLET